MTRKLFSISFAALNVASQDASEREAWEGETERDRKRQKETARYMEKNRADIKTTFYTI